MTKCNDAELLAGKPRTQTAALDEVLCMLVEEACLTCGAMHGECDAAVGDLGKEDQP
jgi:hypothetical protein